MLDTKSRSQLRRRLVRWSRCASTLIWLSLIPAWALSGHTPLLPHPQQIRYGEGRIPVRGLSVRLLAEPSAEDRFSAEHLSNCLSDLAQEPVPVSEGEAASAAIVLKRTGPVDALPMPGERSGPDSREAYVVKVTPKGGEIQAKSSAGLFYGAQTVCQLVEGNAAEATLPQVEIRDWPSLAYRGTMVDMSHGPLPKEDEIKRQLDFGRSFQQG